MSRTAALAAILCLGALTGCESTRSLNPFAEKDTILPGERRPVFEQGSGFEGPRKLPPPNSDYIGATMRADQQAVPAAPAAQPAPGTEPAPAPGTAPPQAPPPAQ